MSPGTRTEKPAAAEVNSLRAAGLSSAPSSSKTTRPGSVALIFMVFLPGRMQTRVSDGRLSFRCNRRAAGNRLQSGARPGSVRGMSPTTPDGLRDLLALHLAPGLGPCRTAALLQHFGSAARARRAGAAELRA